MGQLKRRRPQHLLRPDEMLATLASLQLNALLQHGGLWLAVTPEMSEVLNQCCTGQLDGGPGTAEEVAAVLAPLVGEPQLPQAVRSEARGSAGPGHPGPPACVQRPQQPQEQSPQQQKPQQPPQAQQDVGGVDAGSSADAADAMEVDAVTPQEPCVGVPQQLSAEAQAPAVAGPQLGRPPDAPGGEGTDGGMGTDTATVGSGAGAADEVSAAAAHNPAEGTRQDVAARTPEAAVASPVPGSSCMAASTKGSAPWSTAAERGAPSGGRGRGRRGGVQRPPYTPAADGCRLVAVRLTLEEAFFLHYALRCLQVYELQPGSPIPATAKHVQLLDTEGLWRACSSIRSNFVTSYVAYHHLKAKGWIPRSGLLYGVDYVVYQLHPVGAHSDFGVLVMPLGPGGDSGSGGPHAPPLGWLDLQITNRLINQVVKKLVLLYLYERPGPARDTPHCLANFAVEERIVRRWVPDATRD